ncbi:hypothetical protein [Streptomyces sp. NPDC002215]|uniref:glycosyltransferase family 2 protein n=1 Tax=Streptomyces sp. NPDC002215 TaxID=3154412 RepID=UPI0033262623
MTGSIVLSLGQTVPASRRAPAVPGTGTWNSSNGSVPRAAREHHISGVTTPRRRVPRLRVGDPGRSGTITTMTEGVVVRRDVFDALGGWESGLFLHHEGLDLSSRCWAAGWTGWYAAGLRMHHPPTSPARHALFHRLAARNRIAVAHRNLPP